MADGEASTRNRRLLRWVVATAIGCVSGVALTAHEATASAPDDPPEYLNASETGGTQAEVDYWSERVPCPDLSGATLRPPVAFVGTDSVQISCSYANDNGSSFGGYNTTWSKFGAAEEFVCGLVNGDLGWERQIADPETDARVQVQFVGAPEGVAREIAAGGDALYEFARARGNPCAPYDGPECPVIDGWVRRMFFGPGNRMEVTDFGGGEAQYSCSYRLPHESFELSIEQFFGVEVLREGDIVTADDILIACSAGSWFAFGEGGVGTEGRYSATAEYTIRSADPIDTAPVLAALDIVLEEYGPTGAGCEDLELLPNDPYSPMPVYLADAFSADRITTGRPPIIGTAPDATAADPVADGATAPTTETTADSADPPEAPEVTTPAAAAGGTDRPTGEADGSGGSAWLWRTISIAGIVLTVLSLALTFLLIQRESRVRPRFDVFRIIVTLIVAAAMLFVFAKGAPLWAVVAALALGGVLGYWQGSHLVVRLTERGMFAQRSAWAIVAFAVGIVISQVAGLLNRTGVVSFGIALTFFSAALAAGLLAGRAPRINAARATAISTLGVMIVAMLMAAVPAPRQAVATTDPDEPTRVPDGVGRTETVAPEDRTPAMDALVDMVPWDTIKMNGGLWDDRGKPFVEVAVPRGLDEPPDPVTRTAEWADIFTEDTSYDLTETFTFSMRPDGFCCSVGYEAIGDRTFGDTTEPVELVGKMADIQVFGVEGPGYSGGTFSSTVTGLPFTEIEEFGVGDLTGSIAETTCFRPVAETRNNDAQSLTGGGAVIERATPNVEGFEFELDLRLGAPCDLPDFTIDNALEMAPDVPPLDDPARQLFNAGGCPVRQELLGALHDGTDFEGVHTTTVGELYLDPNGQVCDYGTLFDPPAIGQGGPGNTRHEFAVEFAKPRQGEWDRGYSSWFPDPCCIALPSKMVPPEPALGTENRPQAPTICATDERDLPVAPDDFEAGGSCSLVTQHRIEGVDGAQVWISTEWVEDGPNTTVRVELPFMAFRARCHHCAPGDERIADFIETMIEFGNDVGGDIGEPGEVLDLGEIGEEPGSRQRDAERAAAEAADTARQEAEDLVDLVLPEGASDQDREEAIAVVIAMLGAAAIGASSLSEAGVNPREVWDAYQSGGRDAIDDMIRDRNTPDPMEGAVRDERGEILLPGEDGLYDWDDGDTVRRVPREELDELIASARQAGLDQAIDEARRLAEHDRIREVNWDELRATTRLQTAQEMDRLETERLERERLVARGIRLRDALEDVEDTNLRDRMLDWLERNPAPSDEDFWDMRDIMRQQVDDQRAIDALGDESVMEMALEGIRDDLAELAERSGQPAVAWVIRNPEIPIRLGIAYATGGMSEVALAPIDLWRALNARADAVLATENRDLTTAEIVEEITWAVAIEWIGSRVLGGGGKPDVPTPGKPPMQLLPENYITRVAPGQRIPLLHQAGYTAEHITRLTTFAERNGVIPGARTANQYAAAQIRRGALPKPLTIKPKTIGELDLHLGARADHLGTVGLFKPKMPDTSGMSSELKQAVTARYNKRLAEYTDQFDKIRRNPNLRIEDGRVLDAATGKPFAGDMDLVYLKDAKTGEVITGARYEQLRDQMVEEGLIEHGAEFNIHYDLTQGLTPGTAEYADALRRADEIATGTLMPTHMDGAPIMEIRNGVPVRGEDITYLPVNPGHAGT